MSTGKVFVVTGANRGIGLELARQLSQHGHVIGTARNPSAATDLSALKNVTVVAMDISSKSSIANAAAKVAELAPNGIDELWNNAARHAAKFVLTADEIDDEGWVDELRVNVVGQTLATRAFLPLVRKGQGKKIVFVSSDAASLGKITGGGDACSYCSTKAALNMSIKFWHNQLTKEDILITGIHPGWVITDMGGSNAAITSDKSVSGMLKVIGELDAKSELKPRVWDGSILPW